MKPNILLTCFGGKIFYDVFRDFEGRGDVVLFVADSDPKCPARRLTENFIAVPCCDDPEFIERLMASSQERNVNFIVPCGDEEALELMKNRRKFEDNGILLAVQEEQYLPLFSSKSAMLDFLQRKGVPVPKFRKVVSKEDFAVAIDEMGYPGKNLLLKPDFSRGGRGIVMVTESWLEGIRSGLLFSPAHFLERSLDGKTPFLLMEYIDGVVYDVDVFKYHDGDLFIGVRRRTNNITKLYSGNVFESNQNIISFSKLIWNALPTQYLVDYDIMVDKDNNIHLLEINPRPSGSSLAYIPYGGNLLYALAKSYLCQEKDEVPMPDDGSEVYAFLNMVALGDNQ